MHYILLHLFHCWVISIFLLQSAQKKQQQQQQQKKINIINNQTTTTANMQTHYPFIITTLVIPPQLDWSRQQSFASILHLQKTQWRLVPDSCLLVSEDDQTNISQRGSSSSSSFSCCTLHLQYQMNQEMHISTDKTFILHPSTAKEFTQQYIANIPPKKPG